MDDCEALAKAMYVDDDVIVGRHDLLIAIRSLQSRLAGVEKALLDLYGQISQAEECQSVVITSPSLREAMHKAALAMKET
jgi:hypothetical protein